MKYTFDHSLLSSFKEWFEHHLLDEGRAFTNKTSKLYETNDRRLSSYSTYSAPNYQWVHDSAVSGAIVPTGLTIDGTVRGKDWNGLSIDFRNGRAILDNGNDGLDITGTYSLKEFNTYISTFSIEKMIAEEKFNINPDQRNVTGGLPADLTVLPAIFFQLADTSNRPAQMGGGIEFTNYKIEVVTLARSLGQVVGVNSLFRDTRGQCFPTLTGTPLDYLNDLKGSVWNYDNVRTNSATSNNLISIDEVSAQFFENENISERFPHLRAGYIEFDLNVGRTPQS